MQNCSLSLQFNADWQRWSRSDCGNGLLLTFCSLVRFFWVHLYMNGRGLFMRCTRDLGFFCVSVMIQMNHEKIIIEQLWSWLHCSKCPSIYLARARASYWGITCPRWPNRLVEGPRVGQGHSLFWRFPVWVSICLHCGFDTLSLPRNWNKQNHENCWKKKKKKASGGRTGGYFWRVYAATWETLTRILRHIFGRYFEGE